MTQDRCPATNHPSRISSAPLPRPLGLHWCYFQVPLCPGPSLLPVMSCHLCSQGVVPLSCSSVISVPGGRGLHRGWTGLWHPAPATATVICWFLSSAFNAMKASFCPCPLRSAPKAVFLHLISLPYTAAPRNKMYKIWWHSDINIWRVLLSPQ